jgi:hypothetical protein
MSTAAAALPTCGGLPRARGSRSRPLPITSLLAMAARNTSSLPAASDLHDGARTGGESCALSPALCLPACRRAEDLALADELHAKIGDRLTVLLDERAERIDLATEIAGLHPEAELYVCGPMGLLEAARAEWRSWKRRASLITATFSSARPSSRRTTSSAPACRVWWAAASPSIRAIGRCGRESAREPDGAAPALHRVQTGDGDSLVRMISDEPRPTEECGRQT